MRAHTTTLTTIDPAADLTDLEVLRSIVGDARVVAIGEGAHFVTEFSTIRQRLTRFLAERCGFTHFALEYSFAGADVLDAWLTGGDDRPLGKVSPAAANWGAADLMEWLRTYNSTSRSPLRFAGIDVPEAGGALRPVLEPLADYLAEADPWSLPLVQTALQISDAFLAGADSGAGSGAAAAPAWARLPADRQDALSAALARLSLRIGAIRPLAEARTGAHRTAVAERLLAGARTVDYMFRAMNALFTGTNSAADLSVRDLYMAQTLAWHLEQAGPGARFVLAAHNNHIQKTPAVFDGTMAALPMGQHLARMLGGTYVAIGLTHTDDHVPEMRPDASASVGFTLETTHLPAPRAGTVEAALAGAGLTAAPTLTDLRQAPTHPDGRPLLDGIRTQSAVMDTSLGDAFDVVISTPTATRDPAVAF